MEVAHTIRPNTVPNGTAAEIRGINTGDGGRAAKLIPQPIAAATTTAGGVNRIIAATPTLRLTTCPVVNSSASRGGS